MSKDYDRAFMRHICFVCGNTVTSRNKQVKLVTDNGQFAVFVHWPCFQRAFSDGRVIAVQLEEATLRGYELGISVSRMDQTRAEEATAAEQHPEASPETAIFTAEQLFAENTVPPVEHYDFTHEEETIGEDTEDTMFADAPGIFPNGPEINDPNGGLYSTAEWRILKEKEISEAEK